MDILFALLAAFFIGFFSILVKKGLKEGQIDSGILTTLAINVVIFWLLSLFLVPLKLFLSPHIIWFVLAGVLSPGIARIFYFSGINILGVARTVSILATYPLISIILAIIFLGEKWQIAIILGTLLIILGVIFLSQNNEKVGWKKRHLLIPFCGALVVGLAFPLKKIGLELLNNSLLAVTVAGTASLFTFLVFLILSKRIKRTGFSSNKYYLLGGLSSSIGYVFIFVALSFGRVGVVTPLIQTETLFAILLASFLLKQIEKITPKIILGALLIVSGVIIISVFK